MRISERVLRPLKRGFDVIRAHKKAYITLNVCFYGLIAATMVLARVFPDLQLATQAGTDTSADPFNPLFEATYGTGNIIGAAAITLGVNLIFGAVLTLTAPTLVIPFIGVAFALARVASWGFIFSPTDTSSMSWFIPHMITAVIEAQGYIIVAFAAFVHARYVVQPHRFGFPSRRAGYAAGVKAIVDLYPLIILVLAVAALWEAIELIHIVPAGFLDWWLGKTPVISDNL
jgi:hypothetical protein